MKTIKPFILKILERNDGNALRYKAVYFTGAIIHTIFIVLFFNIRIYQLVLFNVVSVLMYLFGSLFIKSAKWSSVWIVLFYFEIVAHAIACGILLNWSYGFSLYSLMVIPVSYYLTYMDPNIKNAGIFSTVLSIINITATTLAGLFADSGIYITNKTLAQMISVFNFIVSSVVLAIFASIYIYEMSLSVKKLEEKNNELNFLANYDALTKLRNRHHISDLFHIYEEGTAPFCVFLGDIDDFKHINDTYGHDCGDKVLISVADTISKNVGDKGVVCRWGGEEILIIISGQSDECIELIENTRIIIQNQRLSFGYKEIKVTMTFGFADYSEAMKIEKLVSIADSRLYYGKRNGKNQIVYENHS